MDSENKKSIREAVADKIRKGRVKMKSRMHFILRTALIVLALVVLVFFVLYLVSFIMFSLQLSGAWFMPAFGFSGIGVLLRSLPWLLIVVAVALIALLEFFAKRFTFAYRKPALFSLIVIIGIVFVSSFVISGTRLHSDLFLRAKEGELPFAGKLYRDFSAPVPAREVYQGVVSDVVEGGFRIITAQDEELEVIVGSDIRFPFKNNIEKDGVVVIFGKRDDGTVRAFGVRSVNSRVKVFEKPHFGPFRK